MQLDLFAAGGTAPAPSSQTESSLSRAEIGTLSDAAILAAIQDAGFPVILSLIQETGRRRLHDAIPILDRLCRLFAGFGIKHEIPEQVAALDALAAIGGHEARLTLSGLLDDRVVQGPTLKVAARVAADVRCRLSPITILPLLQHGDPEVRSVACDLARPQADINAVLIDLLTDLDSNVRTAAACALGRFGKQEARAVLKDILRRAPTPNIIEACASIADHECIVLLGRLARTRTELAKAALDALAMIEDPLAVKITKEFDSQMDPNDCDEAARIMEAKQTESE
jgi:HEAT repeat protein